MRRRRREAAAAVPKTRDGPEEMLRRKLSFVYREVELHYTKSHDIPICILFFCRFTVSFFMVFLSLGNLLSLLLEEHFLLYLGGIPWLGVPGVNWDSK